MTGDHTHLQVLNDERRKLFRVTNAILLESRRHLQQSRRCDRSVLMGDPQVGNFLRPAVGAVLEQRREFV